jgi:hypothetical protein
MSKGKVVAALAATALLVLVPLTASATSRFTDGPFGAHDAGVTWMAGTGITSGCTATEFCPNAPVTRAQMATFMHRLSGQTTVAPTVNAKSVAGYQQRESTVLAEEAVVGEIVSCPKGTKVVGGGGLIDDLYSMVVSAPLDDVSWGVIWVSLDLEPWPVEATVVATCVPATSGNAAPATAPIPVAEFDAIVASLRERAAAKEATS